MNCCQGNNNNDNNNGKQKGNHKGHLSHMLMMALCCGGPLLLLLVVPFLIKNGSTGTAAILSSIAPFICPLMMIFMIPMMLRGNKDNRNKNEYRQNEPIQIDKKPYDE